MTPAHADLLEQLRAALDAPPNARAIADLQALRGGLRMQFGDLPDPQLLACVDHCVATAATPSDGPVSMAAISDAADAKQLRDRVRGLETRNLTLEQETLGEREEVARLRMQIAVLEAKAVCSEQTLQAMIESDADTASEILEALRRSEHDLAAARAELRGLPEAVAATELSSALTIDEVADLREKLADAIVRLASWRTWSRQTYDAIAPIEERHNEQRWFAMSDEQVRFNLSAQIELLQRDLPTDVLTAPKLAAVLRGFGGRLKIFDDIANSLEQPAA